MDFDPALSFLRTEIDKLAQGSFPLPKGFLDQHVRQVSGISMLLDEELIIRLIRHLETYYGVGQDNGHTLKTKFDEWYPKRKLDIDFYFWKRLQKYWLDHSVLPVQVVNSVDKVTDEILGYLGDPLENKSWRRRGLVMGHVQSGKTTNYSALVAKAADAGYRIIIVLAGITNSLRYQTQVRLDQTFVGRSSLGDALINEIYPVSYVYKGIMGEHYDIRHPYCGTTQRTDFNVALLKGVGATEGNFADPILFVTKKNESVLSQLSEWLNVLGRQHKLDGPVLIIDDEADNASINTAKDPGTATRINAVIRELLERSRRTSYVGYTATPFANIFIDPDTNDKMLDNDLFPEHFIKSLEPPENYIGADKLFSKNGSLSKACVRTIPDDYQDLLPLKHKSTDRVEELPKSLRKAVFGYVIFRALRTLSNDGDRHSSMLVNVSRFNAVQQQIHDEIYRLLQDLKSAVDAWANSASWKKSELLLEVYNVWIKEYDEYSDFSWEQLRKALKPATASIEVRLVNMRGGGLDYSKATKSGLHVVAVGGLALARGLTLEGLAVSYILRNVGAADTLLQMGRWFGYRPGYEKLCRIHITEDMRDDFQQVSEAVEELRNDLIRMERMGITPDKFGLKVRQSPTGIAITAANKMQTAKPFIMAVDLSARHLQAFELFNNNQINLKHYDTVSTLVKRLDSELSDKRVFHESAFVWSGINASVVQEFLRGFSLPQIEFALGSEQTNLALDYIADRANSELCEWDIAIPFRKTGTMAIPLLISGASDVACRQRNSGVKKAGDPDVVKITRKNVVADTAANDLIYGDDTILARANKIREEAEDPKMSLEKAILLARQRPLLLIHLLDFKLDSEDHLSEEKLNFDNTIPVVTVSLAFPDTNIEPKPREYAISVRMSQLLKQQLEEIESDEELEDE